ncbi:MAG: ferritin family protein [Sedimentibacter sp.]
MSNNTFSGLEMLKVAMLMEEEGYNFYKNGANNTTGKTKEFLLAAASQESDHKDKFSKIYNDLSKNKEVESEYLYDDEVTKYLRGLIENQVYNKNKDTKDAFKDIKVAVASSLESESLTVKIYTEMYKGVTEDDAKEVMSKIIEEEKEHVQYFEKLLKDL